MLTVNNLSVIFPDKKLFEDVNLIFNPGNCYGVIGANGAGKSTFLKILSGEKEPTKGNVTIDKNTRLSKLNQDHYAFEENSVMDTVLMGNKKLYDIQKEKDAIYMKPDFSDEDGMRAAELEAEFQELGGYEAEAESSSLLQGLGITTQQHFMLMKDLKESDKVKVLLAQALFGNPGILLLDEPTNGLDLKAILWLQDFLMDFPGIVIIVSHDRYFLNEVCTHMVDVDYGKINMFVGNYDFWYESSQLALRMQKEQNKKKEDKIKELQDFIQRFSANKSKSKQATSRKKLLDKITLDDIKPSSRRYPFVGFELSREVGNEILNVENLTVEQNGNKLIDNLSFRVNKGDKIGFIGNEIAITKFFEIINGNDDDYTGEYKWGQTITHTYFPKDNTRFFEDCDLNLIDWLRQFSEEKSEIHIRGFLGKMLFSGDEALKKANVLSGGEKVRMMFSKMMVTPANVLVFDQPTNHLDLESIEAVNNGLITFKSNILFTSLDHQFVSSVANRIIEIFDDGTYRDVSMNYEDYIEKYLTNN
ncbi:ATP-binding cassette domain-containing protein [Finegoldia sp. BIOML-A3]|uniref:ABC transporter ATP-binding protein n=1 Tax=Finegoldia magna TaxID=1260 RepID=A0A233VNS3_FINMA|nr:MULTISPECIES: ATP-binding cassette domain-containing protein [Finegoldia]MBS5964235.1 ATP-binding cassette domain-containing protein [Finegoldia magna]MBS5970269.1 ATP-binding cassette domain-containing protein [Finegoldia magna]MDU1399413.1 ATP-binding cassette domain-containing protein [Finegoldia magna]MDU2639119.1 ATP-binding cassette domain-containing protein [Finegoldia magna]MDU5960761.1 ATP-binding cassette domain-containing protein [Finegoldia magna]